MESDRWRRIEHVCHAALEHEVGDRGAFLDAACAGDTHLRREVESLIAQQSAAARFLVAQPPGAATPVGGKASLRLARSMMGGAQGR